MGASVTSHVCPNAAAVTNRIPANLEYMNGIIEAATVCHNGRALAYRDQPDANVIRWPASLDDFADFLCPALEISQQLVLMAQIVLEAPGSGLL